MKLAMNMTILFPNPIHYTWSSWLPNQQRCWTVIDGFPKILLLLNYENASVALSVIYLSRFLSYKVAPILTTIQRHFSPLPHPKQFDQIDEDITIIGHSNPFIASMLPSLLQAFHKFQQNFIKIQLSKKRSHVDLPQRESTIAIQKWNLEFYSFHPWNNWPCFNLALKTNLNLPKTFVENPAN